MLNVVGQRSEGLSVNTSISNTLQHLTQSSNVSRTRIKPFLGCSARCLGIVCEGSLLLLLRQHLRVPRFQCLKLWALLCARRGTEEKDEMIGSGH
mmetsp:Transcript_98457/g.261628  ORF Transcript_98457/g.261628 Transcript_98457/m.261628 type:complete len:95 (-) Transcript_98457:618-902(-)